VVSPHGRAPVVSPAGFHCDTTPSHTTQGPSESLLPSPTQRFFARMTPDRPLIFTSRTSDPGQTPLEFLSFLHLQDLRSWTNPIGIPILWRMAATMRIKVLGALMAQFVLTRPKNVVAIELRHAVTKRGAWYTFSKYAPSSVYLCDSRDCQKIAPCHVEPLW